MKSHKLDDFQRKNANSFLLKRTNELDKASNKCLFNKYSKYRWTMLPNNSSNMKRNCQ